MMKDRTNRHADFCLAIILATAMLISGSPDRTAVKANRIISPSGFLKMIEANFLSRKKLENPNDFCVLFQLGSSRFDHKSAPSDSEQGIKTLN